MPNSNISVLSHHGVMPQVEKAIFIADGVRLIGDVRLGQNVSIWFNSVLRGDVNYIEIGADCNIQDNSCLHVENGLYPLILGRGVTVGHSVTLHGCTIGDYCLIGMGAIVLNNAEIGAESIVAAGALVPEGMKIPPRSLVMGMPAKVKRSLQEKDIPNLHRYAEKYIAYAKSYL